MLMDTLKRLWAKAKEVLQKFKAWAEENPKGAAILVAVALPVSLALIGGYLITNALIYALLTVAAFGILIWKMRMSENKFVRRAYELMRRHPLLSDIAFTATVFMLSPGGITGMLGAATAAVIASCIIVVMPEAEVAKESKKTPEPVAV